MPTLIPLSFQERSLNSSRKKKLGSFYVKNGIACIRTTLCPNNPVSGDDENEE
jgi:hypothetical protein